MTSIQTMGSSSVRESLKSSSNGSELFLRRKFFSFVNFYWLRGKVHTFQKLWLKSEITRWDCESIMSLLQFQDLGKELGLVRKVLISFAIATCRAKGALAIALSQIFGIFQDHGLLVEE